MIDFKDSINKYYGKVIEVINNLDRNELNEAMNAFMKVYEDEGTIYTCGNGGSAATASHYVCDFNKGISESYTKKFRVVCLSDNTPTITAIANDIGYDEIFSFQLQGKLRKEDLLVAISGSGNSKNVIKAAEYAKECGIKIVGITGYNGGKIKNISDYKMHANIDDMQISEDIHMMFDHMMMRVICDYLENKKEELM